MLPTTDPIAATLFQAASTAALGGWLLLALTVYAERVRERGWRVTGIVLPAAFAVAYVAALAAALHGGAHGGFGSIGAVRALFASDIALAGGWVHYLAFDLMVGTGIARAGIAARTPRPLLLVCLALTFLVGPAGLLAYLVLRAAARTRASSAAARGSSTRSAHAVEVLA